MSVSRPAARCLFCSFSRPTSTAVLPHLRRQFHASPSPCKEANNKPKSVKKIPPPQKDGRAIKEHHFQPYTEKEKALLRTEYSKEQIAAIEAGEQAITSEDLAKQLLKRDDAWSFSYLDDFSTIEPVVDHHQRAPVTNYDPNSRLKNEDELLADIGEFVDKHENPTAVDFLRFTDNMRLTVGKPEAEFNPHSSLVPDIFEAGETLYNGHKPKSELKKKVNTEYHEISPNLRQLMQVTGYTEQQIRGLKVKALVMHDVVNQTRLGKIRKSYVLAVAGNGRGLLGIGEGKSEEASEARVQAQYRAIRNMQPILRYENRTIYGEVEGKVGAVELKLINKPPGWGLRCQRWIWEMCRVAGISDISARVTRSRNPMNTIKATYQALLSQRNPEDIARGRGKKLVDVRKVYYAGNV